MMSNNRHELSKQIKQSTKLTIREYCRNELKVNEKTFYYRLRTGMIYFADLFKILDSGIDIEVFRQFVKQAKQPKINKPVPGIDKKEDSREDASKEKTSFYIDI